MWPQISVRALGLAPSYPLVTVVFTLFVVATIVAWPRDDQASPSGMLSPLDQAQGRPFDSPLILSMFEDAPLAQDRPFDSPRSLRTGPSTRRSLRTGPSTRRSLRTGPSTRRSLRTGPSTRRSLRTGPSLLDRSLRTGPSGLAPLAQDRPFDSPLAQDRLKLAVPIVAAVAAIVVVFAMYRWTRVAAWQAYGADMLIVIREATRRFLNGHTPYATYSSYDAPWHMAMPYGPALWGPFLLPQLLRLDFRMVTIVGELFIPVWCGVAAVVESARGSIASAASWLAVLAALVLAFDVQGFTLIGHTPVYWPLLPLFAVMAARRRWIDAGCFLGLIVVARTTMVALIPVFLMAAWRADRRRFPAVLIVLTATIGAMLAPFIVWDSRAIWEGMVLSYPRVMKAAVWPELVRPGIETVGVTEWLLEQHREWLVMPVQVGVMIGVYAATWPAIRRGARPLPWMALALFAFSMTTLWPVHYLYYDVLLLLVSGAMVETLEPGVRNAVPRRGRMPAPSPWPPGRGCCR